MPLNDIVRCLFITRYDELRFYSKMKMCSLDDGRKQFKKYNRKSNNRKKICLKFKTSNEMMAQHLGMI